MTDTRAAICSVDGYVTNALPGDTEDAWLTCGTCGGACSAMGVCTVDGVLMELKDGALTPVYPSE
jgi:hypothetical protein